MLFKISRSGEKDGDMQDWQLRSRPPEWRILSWTVTQKERVKRAWKQVRQDRQALPR